MIDYLYQDITYDIRGACYWVWKELGSAHKEKIIEKALTIELQRRGRKVENQKRIAVYYQEQKVGTYVPDMIVDDKILVELKTVQFLTKHHKAQFTHYIQGSQYEVGLLIKFGEKGLEIHRKYCSNHSQMDHKIHRSVRDQSLDQKEIRGGELHNAVTHHNLNSYAESE